MGLSFGAASAAMGGVLGWTVGAASGLQLVAVLLFGLLIGSFLNVVIHRLPKMMERAWQQELNEYAAQQATEAAAKAGKTAMPAPPDNASTPAAEPYNLVLPRSACPACAHPIRWFENIPVLSWLGLRGKCSACGTRISLRYPVVELAFGLWAMYCAWRFGMSITAAAWAAFGALLLVMALIDWDTTLLPDDLTLSLLWLGLVASALRLGGLPGLTDAVWGAVAGYGSLWSIYWLFKLATGKEGMGYGDFKLFAALGAWMGWWALIPMILMASVIGALVGIGLKLTGGLREGRYVPFGPFLAGAGLVALVFGPQSVLRILGL